VWARRAVTATLYAPAVAELGYGDDATLARALSAGDKDAFAYLLDRYHGPLLRLALQYVPSRAVAEEVVQETWLAVIRGVDRFEGRSSLKTWIYRILMNIARSRGVKEHRSVPFTALADADDDEAPVDGSRFRRLRHAGHWKQPPVPWPDPEERAVQQEELAVVRAAIDALPAAQRTVITMRDVLGFTSDEVCDALDITAVNQRVLLHRARSRVRGALEQHFAPEVTA
jgi:RNA polymerase sigma-70 factor, ECF subfamily